MSQEVNKEESHEQENLYNSFAYNEYKTLTPSNSISTDKNQDSALECYECNSIGDGELCTYSSHIFTSSELFEVFVNALFRKKCLFDKVLRI